MRLFYFSIFLYCVFFLTWIQPVSLLSFFFKGALGQNGRSPRPHNKTQYHPDRGGLRATKRRVWLFQTIVVFSWYEWKTSSRANEGLWIIQIPGQILVWPTRFGRVRTVAGMSRHHRPPTNIWPNQQSRTDDIGYRDGWVCSGLSFFFPSTEHHRAVNAPDGQTLKRKTRTFKKKHWCEWESLQY